MMDIRYLPHCAWVASCIVALRLHLANQIMFHKKSKGVAQHMLKFSLSDARKKEKENERGRDRGRVVAREQKGIVTKASCSCHALKLIKSRLPGSAVASCLFHFRHSSSSHCASWAHPHRRPHRCPLFMLLLMLLLLLLSLSSCGAFSSRLAGFGFPVGTHTDKAPNTCLAVKAN